MRLIYRKAQPCKQQEGEERSGMLAGLGALDVYEGSPPSSSSLLVLALHSRYLRLHRSLARAASGYGEE